MTAGKNTDSEGSGYKVWLGARTKGKKGEMGTVNIYTGGANCERADSIERA